MLRFRSGHRLVKGFTLVELLVVIGIISVLIAILLPSLNKARRQAATIQCQSNMRSIALGLIQYANDNKSHNIIGWITPGGTNGYPDGWGWAGELMFQGYVKSENYYVKPNDTGPNPQTQINRGTVFRCPEDLDVLSGSTGAGSALYPTDRANNGYSISMPSNVQPRADGQPLHAVVTSYGLSVNNDITASKASTVTPYINFKTPGAGVLGNAKWTRTLSMIHKSSITIMLLESGGVSDPWTATTGAYQVGGITYSVTRVAARHGQRFNTAVGGGTSITGSDAYTNIAFFDGHVGEYASWPLFSKAYQQPTGATTGASPWLWLGDPTVGIAP